MEWRLSLFLLAACTAILWRTGAAQDMSQLSSSLSKLIAAKEAMDKFDDLERKNLEEALQSIQLLWTEHVPLMLQEQTSLDNTSLSESCKEDILDIFGITIPGMKFPGAGFIPLIDATGKQGAGLMQGNFIMDAAYDECFSYNYTAYCLADPVSLISPIEDLEPILKAFGWSVGFCVPKNCGPSDIKFLLSNIEVLNVTDTNVLCTKTKRPEYNVGAIVMLCVTMILLVLVIVGSVVDVVVKHIKEIKKENEDSNIGINNDSSINGTAVNDNEKQRLLPMKIEKPSGSKVKPLDFIIAFSLFQTVPTLLATKQNASVITNLNGLRVISMFWVILGHTFFWLFQTDKIRVDNLLEIRTLLERFSFQAINPGAFFAVDTFFFLSGVLVAYIVLRQMNKRKGRFPFVQYYVHRYLRLTPSYGFILFFAWFLTPYLSYGPRISLHNPYAHQCSKYWWTNFLYINNFIPWELTEQCVGWSWYLANDMQFYVISPLILITAYKMFPVSMVISGGLMTCGFLITAVLTGVYRFQSNVFSQIAYNYSQSPDAPTNFEDAIYIKPWGRIAPYLVGIMFGYVFYKQYKINFRQKYLNIAIYLTIWFVAAFVALWLVYGLYFTWHGHVPSMAENIIYITFGRVLWSLCIAAVVYACHTGYGWFINSFLSMKMWTPLARITYNAYLVHPVVIEVVYGQLQGPFHYTDVSVAAYAVAYVVLAYSVAACVCIVVEFPLGTIEMKLFDLFGSFGRKSLRHNQKTYEDDIKKSPNPANA